MVDPDPVTVKTRDHEFFYLKSGHWEGDIFLATGYEGFTYNFPREFVIFVRFAPPEAKATQLAGEVVK